MSKSKRSAPYQPLGKESDSLSYQPNPGAYDSRALFNKKRDVPANVVNSHTGGASPNDTERALDISMGRRSFRQPGDND
jgi:hypothetical protein